MSNPTELNELIISPQNYEIYDPSPTLKAVNLVVTHLNNKFDQVHDHIEVSKNEILTKLEKTKKEKAKVTRLLERDPIDLDFYKQLMDTKRQKRERILHYSRFRVAVTLLFFTGARVNEIRNLTEKEVYNLLKENVIIINQSKTQSLRKVVVGEKAMKHLKAIEKDIDTVFSCYESLGGGHSPVSFIKFINKRLKRCASVYRKNLIISSHSFRINFVTKLLEKLPIHLVKDIVNHQSIQTTLKYSRNRLSDSEKASAIDSLLT